MNFKVIRLNDEDTGENNTYFIIKVEDFEKAKELCKKAEDQFYYGEAPYSLYEMILDAFTLNDIEFSVFANCDVDYDL